MFFNTPFVRKVIVNSFLRRFIMLFDTYVPHFQFGHFGTQVFICLAKAILKVNQFGFTARQGAKLGVAVSFLQFFEMIMDVVDGILIIMTIRDKAFLYASHSAHSCFNKRVLVKIQIR